MNASIVALVGNPNSGKTTVFNSLTGGQQEIGNWCGVTVEKKRGRFQEADRLIEVIDLPGCYNCFSTINSAIDEQITAKYLASKEAELIINVVDATNLERHLYLTLQLLEQGFPVIVVLNMMDAAHKQGIDIKIPVLVERLGCPVLPVSATKKEGIQDLKKAILTYQSQPSSSLCFGINASDSLPQNEVAIAKARYEHIHTILKAGVFRTSTLKSNWTDRIDKVVLNRFVGIPFFLLSMYIVFIFAIQVGGIFQDFFDISSRTIFINAVEQGLTWLQVPQWFTQLMSLGVGQGINTTLSFVPVLAAMFFSLSFLEASGYMSRAAFVMDKVMHWAGLPGKSFIPMIIGFGCNVPAVMAARTLDNYRERILTILMSPFMSCGARLAIYALFVAAFFPIGGQNIIFGLYLIGILIALLTGFILRSTVLPGERSALIIELPPYRWPTLKGLGRATLHRLKQFVLKAGTLIILFSVLMSTVGIVQHKMQTNNWLSIMGRHLTPLFKPMGIEEDNWPATVGLLTGILAKEVVVGTLNTLYLQEEYLESASLKRLALQNDLREAWESIPNNWSQLGQSIAHPLLILNTEQIFNEGDKAALGIIVKRFQSTAAAFAYLLFVLLYFPCISVVAAIAKELNRSWAVFSVVWTTSIAYITAVLFYQASRVLETPKTSLTWIAGLLMFLALGFYGVRKLMHYKSSIRRKRALPTPILILDT